MQGKKNNNICRVIHGSLMRITDKYINIISNKLGKDLELVFNRFKNHIRNWDHDFNKESAQATIFAIWEMEYHISFLSDQIPERKLRETMTNIPDSDLFLIDILEGLENDPHYMDEYWASNFTMFKVNYTTTDHKCLMSLVYSGIYSWNLLTKVVSSNPENWRWGKIHQHYYEHIPFSMIPLFKSVWHKEVEAGGSRRTISFGLYDFYNQDLENKIFIRSNFASNFRAAIDMASFEDPSYPMYMSLDTGLSQHAFSPYYFNMNKIHYSYPGYRMELGLENSMKNARHKLELIPADK